jgi:hypothetical protein
MFEAGFPKPEFTLFRDGGALLDQLYRRLEPHGLRLADIRFERGTGADQHFLIYLFNYWMTVRIRVERIEVTCSELPQDLVEKFKAAILDVLRAVREHKADLSFRAFAVAVGFHAKLEGQPVRNYLAQFVTNAPQDLGASTGSGVVFYFGAEGDRLLSSITADLSLVVPDGLFVRVHGLWDAGRVAPESIARVADAFVRQALESIHLQLPV